MCSEGPLKEKREETIFSIRPLAVERKVIVVAATNRADVLDQALLRPALRVPITCQCVVLTCNTRTLAGNFERLVHCCIDADFCKQIIVGMKDLSAFGSRNEKR